MRRRQEFIKNYREKKKSNSYILYLILENENFIDISYFIVQQFYITQLYLAQQKLKELKMKSKLYLIQINKGSKKWERDVN